MKMNQDGAKVFGLGNGKIPFTVIAKTASVAGLRKIAKLHGMFGSHI